MSPFRCLKSMRAIPFRQEKRRHSIDENRRGSIKSIRAIPFWQEKRKHSIDEKRRESGELKKEINISLFIDVQMSVFYTFSEISIP